MNIKIRKPDRNWKESVKTIIEMGKFLQRMRENFSNQDIAKMMQIDFNFDQSTVAKLIKIAEHPILGDPQHIDSLPKGWGTIYELKFLPEDVLLNGLKNGYFRNATKYDIWALRGVKFTEKHKKPISQAGAGGRVTAAPDQSLVQYVREGMAKLPKDATGQLVDDMARKLKIGITTMRMIRGMIILSERPELTQADRDMVLGLLDKIDRTRNVRTYYQQVKPLMDGIWGHTRNKTFTEKSSKKRIEVFRNAIVILRDTCDRVYEMDLPYMSTEDVDRSINDLVEARRQIAKLAENLRRSKND